MKDIKFDTTGDVDISNNDIQYGESTAQHERDIILTHKGHYKSVPAVGVGALNYVNDENPDNFLRAIRKELSKDGMKVKRVRNNNGNIEIDASY